MKLSTYLKNILSINEKMFLKKNAYKKKLKY